MRSVISGLRFGDGVRSVAVIEGSRQLPCQGQKEEGEEDDGVT